LGEDLNHPFEKLEDAAAQVGTAAGNSLVRGIARLAGAAFEKWVTTREAEAAAARIAVETKTEIDRKKALTGNRRQSELEEINHQALLERRLLRLRHELAREQANLEAISLRSLQLTEGNPGAEKARELDDDWMFTFARYAQNVSDKDIQELWARILSSAAIEGKQRLSPPSLQAMSLMDKKTADNFKNFCATIAAFGFCPPTETPYQNESQNIDLSALKELTLIQDNVRNDGYPFGDFMIVLGEPSRGTFGLLQTTFILTQRGAEIANAVFKEDALTLSDEVQQKYLQATITMAIDASYGVSIVLPSDPGEVVSPFYIGLTHPRGASPVKGDLAVIEKRLSARVRRLLDWAETRYDVILGNNIPSGPTPPVSFA
jgi:Protein of unknown function (DUF2806)